MIRKQQPSSVNDFGVDGYLQTADVDVSGSSGSASEWTQTEGVWAQRPGGADSSAEAGGDANSDLFDELERLRRERQRILDMLARDAMPSKLQVRVT